MKSRVVFCRTYSFLLHTQTHIYEVYVLVQIDLHIYTIHRFRYLYLALAFIEHSNSEYKFCTVKTFQYHFDDKVIRNVFKYGRFRIKTDLRLTSFVFRMKKVFNGQLEQLQTLICIQLLFFSENSCMLVSILQMMAFLLNEAWFVCK